MKKHLFISLLVLGMSVLFISCGEKDEFFMRNMSASELESGTATFVQRSGSEEWFIYFKNGYFGYSYLKRGEVITMGHGYKYKLGGNTFTLEKKNYKGELTKYDLTLDLVHWGDGKGEQLRLVDLNGDNVPYNLEEGYYDKSYESLADYAFTILDEEW